MTLSAQQHEPGLDFDRSIQTQPAGKACGGDGNSEVGAILRRAEYVRDLDALDAAGGDGGCFFTAMGEIIARRAGAA